MQVPPLQIRWYPVVPIIAARPPSCKAAEENWIFRLLFPRSVRIIETLSAAIQGGRNTERYRSGRNELDSKSSCPQGHVGSNPTRSATSSQASYRLRRFFSKVTAHSFCCGSFPNRTRCAAAGGFAALRMRRALAGAPLDPTSGLAPDRIASP